MRTKFMKYKCIITSFIVGLIFGIGLVISGMTQPSKVMGFLDIFGSWDPSLIFVMIGGITVHSGYFFLIKPKFNRPVLTVSYQVPQRKDITASLITGSLLFGIGWAIGGYCPGPAITSLATFSLNPLVFIASMLVGMAIYKTFENKIPLVK
jgi:uncharacterized membrane protein YedE/YeeE